MFGQGSWAVLPETRSSCWSELLGSRGASDPFHEPADRHLIEHQSAMLKAYGQNYEHVVRFCWTKWKFLACKSVCRPAEQRNTDGRQLELHIQDLRRMAPPRVGPISARGQPTLVALCGS